MMALQRFQRIRSLFEEALQQASESRAAFLESACGGDRSLYADVWALLQAHQETRGFLVQPALRPIDSLLAAEQSSSIFEPGDIVSGRYEITTLTGQGGMGEVYGAIDRKLRRRVALKVIGRQRSSDPQWRERLEREAQAISRLNHPHICNFFDLGCDGSIDFLVMEFLDGETLAHRLQKGPLPVEEVLRIGIEMTSALAWVHRHGVIHRDVKPGNIFITPCGAKLLDFGLAKFTRPEWATAEFEIIASVVDEPLTAAGAILGTVHYMSPEQALGQTLDRRADLFSLGVVLYQMLTGVLPFEGNTAAAVFDAIIHREPTRPTMVNPAIPRGLEQIIERTLEKDPQLRYQSAPDLAADLTRLQSPPGAGPALIPSVPWHRVRRFFRKRRTALAALCVAAPATGALMWTILRGPGETEPPSRLPTPIRLTADVGLTAEPAISADGKIFAYASDRGAGDLELWLQPTAGGGATRLTDHPADDREPAFSPDGKRIAFRSERDGGGIYVLSLLTGRTELLVREGRRPRFSPDGRLIAYWVGSISFSAAAPGSGAIYTIAADGRKPRRLQPGFSAAREPVWSPDGRSLLFLGNAAPNTPAGSVPSKGFDWWITPVGEGPAVSTGVLAALGPGFADTSPSAWTPDHQIIFSARTEENKNLWSIALAPEGKVAGAPRQLTFGTDLMITPSLSADGRLVFASLSENRDLWMVPLPVDRARAAGEPERVTETAGEESLPSLSTDGARLAFISRRSGTFDVWVKDFVSGVETALTGTSRSEYWPTMSPDGSAVAYTFNDDQGRQAYIADLPGGPARKICEDCPGLSDWLADGSALLHWWGQPRRVSLWHLASSQRTDVLASPRLNLYGARFSPDQRWICFFARRSPERAQIYVARFQRTRVTPQSEWIPVSDGESWEVGPKWAPDGNRLYFTSSRDGFTCLWAQDLDPVSKRPLGKAHVLRHFHNSRRSLHSSFLSVARGKIVFDLADLTGNVWTTSFTTLP